MAEVGRRRAPAEEPPFRIRSATREDASTLPMVIGSTLSHPAAKGRRGRYDAAAQRDELLLLERYDSKARRWQLCAFVDWHIRVDDVLTLRDVGTEGPEPHPGMVKQLVLELLRSLSPVEAIVKVRADAADWNDILASIGGFTLEGSEYRRPYWIKVWKWTPRAAPRASRGAWRSVLPRGSA